MVVCLFGGTVIKKGTSVYLKYIYDKTLNLKKIFFHLVFLLYHSLSCSNSHQVWYFCSWEKQAPGALL